MKLNRTYLLMLLGLILLAQCQTAKAQCNARFSYGIDSGVVVTFVSDTLTNGRYFWDFGDSTFSTSPRPRHRYELEEGNDSAVYWATLTHVDGQCIDTFTQRIVVGRFCESSFMYSIQRERVMFVNTSDFRDSVAWKINGIEYENSDTVYFYFVPSVKDQYVSVEINSFSPGWNCSMSTRDSVLIPANPCYAFLQLAVDTTKPFTLYLINRSFDLPGHRYEWRFGDGESSNERNPTHKYESFGKYSVCLSVFNEEEQCQQEYCLELGLDKDGKLLKEEGFTLIVFDYPYLDAPKIQVEAPKLFPNPATNHVRYVNEDWDTYSVYSYQGIHVLEGELTKGEGTLDVSHLAPGMYVIRFYAENDTAVRKIIISRP